MLTSVFEKIPLAIAGILLIAAIARIYFRSVNVNRSEFMKIFKTAKYITPWVIITTIILTGVFGIFNHINAKKSVHAIISLNFSEASQALNSNGTRYNMNEIICDEVVKRAIEKGAFEDVTVKQLKDSLLVYPYVQGGVGDEAEYHISTEFAVEYNASKHTQHLDSENVIKLITSAYKEYYTEKYTDNFRLDSRIEKSHVDNMEYMDIVAYFNKETSAILNYLYGMAEKEPSYVTENDTTFNSIAGKVHQFKETQINQNLKFLILQNGIVRNKNNFVGRLQYQNRDIDFDRRKNQASYDLCNQAISRYSEEMTRIVLVPTWDESGKYYMGRTKVGIDELSVKATEFSNNVASNEKQMQDNNLLISKIGAQQNNADMQKTADELIDTVYSSIKAFEKEAINAGREYSAYKMNQCIAVSIYGISFMNLIKSMAVFALLAYVALMLFEISGKFPKKS